MSLVVVGVSSRTAPVSLLERAAVGPDALPGFLSDALSAPHVAEAVAVSTCNRIELYADVRAFHAGVAELTSIIAGDTRIGLEELTPHLYVHYEDRAVQHLLGVACGLDSMVVGEGQILGQVRSALKAAQDSGSAGRTLNELFQLALRVGKRAHTETGIDQAGSAVVTAGLELADRVLGGLAGRSALVVGAGSMSSLVALALDRAGAANVVIANRGTDRAAALAAQLGGRAVGLDTLAPEVAAADVVVSCTGATGFVLDEATLRRAHAGRDGRPLVLVDLALPRDIDPVAHSLAGVTLVDLEGLTRMLDERGEGVDVEAVRSIVAEEVSGHVVQRQAARVAPTVVALRAMADDVVSSELARFDSRRPEIAEDVRAEVERTVRRVVDKVLHAPTVRVKELASQPSGLAYAEALQALFDLDPVRYREVAVADVHPVEVDTELDVTDVTHFPDGGLR
jgi:glutamyl-tRNA reductase